MDLVIEQISNSIPSVLTRIAYDQYQIQIIFKPLQEKKKKELQKGRTFECSKTCNATALYFEYQTIKR